MALHFGKVLTRLEKLLGYTQFSTRPSNKFPVYEAAFFHESGRALTIGQTSGGSSGNPLTFPLTGGGQIRFSTGAFYTRSGLLVEGNGIQPQIRIPYTVADVQQSRDPDLLAAQAELARLTARR